MIKIMKNEKCAYCPLAGVLEMAINLNKGMVKTKMKEYKPIKDYGGLLDLSKQLN